MSQHGPFGVEDAHVEVGHQHEDAFVLVGPADPDVVQLGAVAPQR